jgi:sulfur-oxidizing protein SoxX
MRMIWTAVAVAVTVLAGGVTMSGADPATRAVELMKRSFKERGQAKLDRLDQDDMQATCSRLPKDGPVSEPVAVRIQKASLESVKVPADGALVGDWRQGEKIAQSGRGQQFNDDPKQPSGANCYACHELSGKELSFGTIGPSLRHYGKQRGASPEIQRYTYAKIWNAQAFRACSAMPRFGHKGILTEEQIKHVVGLLLDPESPVNK